MDTITESRLTKFLYLSVSIVFAIIVFYNIRDPWLTVFLSGLLMLTITLRRAILYENRKYALLSRLTFLFDILLVLLISSQDASGCARMYYFIIIADASTSFKYSYNGVVSALCIFSYLLERIFSGTAFSDTEAFYTISFNTFAMILFYAVMSMVKHEISQRQKLNRTMQELKLKTKMLEDSYIKLRDTSEDIEEMTVLGERNRIAREIHDTMGHTLTTVLIEIEACERLIKKDPELATEKLRLAKGQVRNGISSIRESVSVLNSGREVLGLAASVKLLLEETAKHGDIFVNYEIGNLPKLSSQQEKTLYRAIQEGLTNGIKHGGSTAFVFKLKAENGNIEFLLEDNGKGCEKITPGFGLATMEQRVREVGGIFNIHSAYGEGCRIAISIPLREETSADAD